MIDEVDVQIKVAVTLLPIHPHTLRSNVRNQSIVQRTQLIQPHSLVPRPGEQVERLEGEEGR